MAGSANGGGLYLATSLPDALAALAERGAAGAPMAGATWIMRRPGQQGHDGRAYVGLSRIAALRQITVEPDQIRIGACATHAELAVALADLPECRVLAEAAGRSANPSVRAVATVGGNLCAHDFAAADLVPALLCLDATAEVTGKGGTERLALADFLAMRASLEPGRVLTELVVPRRAMRSAHVRLPLRVAGDYPVAMVSLAATLDGGEQVEAVRLAVGSVEKVARRWPALEERLQGQALDPDGAAEAAKGLLDGFQARDGVEVSGSYRLRVLPALVRRAVAAALA